MSARDILQIVAARADDPEPAPGLRLAAHRRKAHRLAAGEIIAGERVRIGHDVVGRAFGDDLAAVNAGAGPHIDHMIGGQDRVFVMFDDDHRIAEIAQPPQRVEQPRIVALMQADRGLVEHVEHAGQARADLRGEPDALALAARQRAGGARQRQIVEADVDEERQALANLLQNAAGDLVALRVEPLRQVAHPFDRGPDREIGDFADMPPVDLDRERFRLQPVAVAGRARCRRHIARNLLARPFALGFEIAPFEIADDAFEGLLHVVAAQPIVIGHRHRLVAGAEQDHVAARLRQRRATAYRAGI